MSWKGWVILAVILAGAAAALGVTLKKTPSEQSEASPKGTKVREAAVAGLFYPADKKSLSTMIDSFLARADAPPLENVRGLVSPHAGYEFSGPIAAYGYKQLVGRKVRTVIVMGPSHYAYFTGASIPDVDMYRTPLGTIPLSPKARELAGIHPLIANPPCRVERPSWWRQSSKKAPAPGEDTPHTWEHSLEVQLPFLQKTLADFTLVPIVFGEVDPEQVANILKDHIDDATILIASSDLSHYKPYEVANRMDRACVKAVCDFDIEAMKKQEACGKGPILTLMHIAKRKGWKAKLLDYRNSGDTAGDKSGVVGYAAIAFYEPPQPENKEN